MHIYCRIKLYTQIMNTFTTYDFKTVNNISSKKNCGTNGIILENILEFPKPERVKN
jgi:hypothetical protein